MITEKTGIKVVLGTSFTSHAILQPEINTKIVNFFIKNLPEYFTEITSAKYRLLKNH
jgi:hypothetical protein